MTNFLQIKFGITKVFRTFEVPNTTKVADEATKILGGIFFAINSIDTVSKERCRNYRNCLNTIVPPLGIRQRKVRHRFFVVQKCLKTKYQMNNQIELPSLKDEANLPEALQSALSDYFQFNGTLADIEANLWTMMETATAGCEEVGLSAKDVLDFMMFYKTTKALVSVLHSYHAKTTVELCNN